MAASDYLEAILRREAVDTGIFSPVRRAQATIAPLINEWAGKALLGISPSGSFAKGTGNKSGTDIDLFISLSETTNMSLKDIYESLHETLRARGYTPRRQNVSLSIAASGYKVDLVPGKRQSFLSTDHSLYRRKADTWTQTNIQTHIIHVLSNGRLPETRILKLWRDQKGLDFPSFYLEMTVINALAGSRLFNTPDRVMRVLEYLRDSFANARVVDPANTNNVVSDDLTNAEKAAIKSAAECALRATDWNQIVI